MRPVLLALLALAPVPARAAGPLADVLRDGDLVLQQSTSPQSAALRAATGSPYTHVGMVFRRDGALAVIEAVEPVRWTPLAAWVDRGRDDVVVALRLRDPTPLENGGAAALRAAAEGYLGRHYDLLFGWGDDRLYCSELTYKAYDAALGVQVGERAPVTSFDLAAPEVQALVQARTAGKLDLTERMVAPASLLADADLVVVWSNDPAWPASAQ